MRIPILTSLALPLAACAGYAETAETPTDRMRQLTGGTCDADDERCHGVATRSTSHYDTLDASKSPWS